MTTELSIEVGLLRGMQERTTTILESISTNIGAISDVEKALSKIVAVHEEKFKYQEKTNQDLANAIERVSQESRELFKEAISKIEKAQETQKREMSEFRAEVITAITDLRTDTVKSAEKNEKSRDEEIKDLQDRVQVLERWRYYIIGVIAIASWAINHIINYFSTH